MPSTPVPLDSGVVRARIDDALEHFLATRIHATGHDHRIGEPGCVRDSVLGGGKRLRPVLCVLGSHAAGGDGTVPEPVVCAASSLELFHAFALIHDDIMDDSEPFPTWRDG